MPEHHSVELLVADAATSSGTLADRGRSVLEVLHRAFPVDGAWLALADPFGPEYHSLASVHVDDPVVRFLSGPLMARDIEVTGTNKVRPPLSASDLPYPAETLPTWAECLLPAGIHEALAVALFAPDGRHVGFLALLFGDRRPPPPELRRGLQRITPVLARGIDPMRSLRVAARLVGDASAGVVIGRDRVSRPLPGLPGHPLLVPGSPALAAAAERIDDGEVHAWFLWPATGTHAPGDHVRVSALALPADVPFGLAGLVLVSPAPHSRGLTPRELEVLGLVIEGCSNAEIAAHLALAPRTAAAHLEHVLAKLDAPTRTLAAVRAEREGLYVPPRRRAHADLPTPRQPMPRLPT